MRLKEYLKQGRLVTDGAMGTYFETKYPGEGPLAEALNISCPEKIEAIHLEYIKSGAKLIRTNTFAANTMFFEGIGQVKQIIKAGWQAAQAAVAKSGGEIFIAADIGPVHDPQFLGKEQALQEYFAICDAFLECGADIFVLETQAEFTYVKDVASYLKKQKDVFVAASFAVDKSGYTRSGLGMARIIRQASDLAQLDAYGFNCGVGAAHLKRLLEQAVFSDEKYLMALPNAGYPVELRGRTVYQDNRDYFVEMMRQIAGLGANILGGCCGTSPQFIRDMAKALKEEPVSTKKIAAGHARAASLRPLAEKMEEPQKKLFLVELDPPFGVDASKVLTGAALLKEAGADLLTLADSPMARVRMDAGKLAAYVQRETGLPVMPHICCRDKNVIAMRSGILGDYLNGLRHFLVVTGDPVGRDDRGVVTPVFDFNSIRFMEYLAEMNADVFAGDPVCYGGALNYHGANADAVVGRIKQKMENGCSMFLTQPIYSSWDIERVAYLKQQSGAKVMCGILPLVSYKNAVFLANEMPGIRIPEEIIARYQPDMGRQEAEETGIALAVELVEKMWGFADGFYVMTPFNRAGMAAGILQEVKRSAFYNGEYGETGGVR